LFEICLFFYFITIFELNFYENKICIEKKKKHWLRLIPDESGSKSMAG